MVSNPVPYLPDSLQPKAGIGLHIGPFARFIAERVRWGMESTLPYGL